jgi:hypothetical protein
MKQLILTLALALASTLSMAAPAVASEQDDVMKPVRQWVESLNKGDTKAAIAACAKETSIIDEFPPHEWHGEGTCARWVTELEAFNTSLGITDSIVTLAKPHRVDINGDRAYVVVRNDFHYKEKGKPGQVIGALFTVSLKKEQTGWRITGWAWSRP